MNARLREIADKAREYAMTKDYSGYEPRGFYEHYTEKLAQLALQECILLLEFHGFADAVGYVKYMATDEFGAKE